jgi:hypothetical protein
MLPFCNIVDLSAAKVSGCLGDGSLGTSSVDSLALDALSEAPTYTPSDDFHCAVLVVRYRM